MYVVQMHAYHSRFAPTQELILLTHWVRVVFTRFWIRSLASTHALANVIKGKTGPAVVIPCTPAKYRTENPVVNILLSLIAPA